MNNQAKVVFTAFIYFSMFLDMNNKSSDIPKPLMRLFRKLAKITKMYENHLDEVLKELNSILKGINVEIDYLLISVTIIAEYYEQTKGKKRLFYPMSWDKILELQDECLELSDQNAKDTFEVAEKIVREMLK